MAGKGGIGIRKTFLRKKLRESLARMSRSARRRKSRRIVRHVIADRLFQKSKAVLTYVSLPGEVATTGLIRRCLALGKKVFVPCIDPRRRRMRIFRINHPVRGLRRGCYGVREPDAARAPKANPGEIDLVIAPGVGFDRRGGRLGRGGGYFDRFLKKARRARKIGIAFGEQIVPKIPEERHDVRMDLVITEEGELH